MLIERVYRIILRLYPAEFREEYGDELASAARSQARRRPLLAALQAAADLFLHVPNEQLTATGHDLRYTLRSWRSSPAVPVTALIALALGIGANTAMFSVLHGVLLRPLTVQDPDRLVRVYETNQKRGLPDFTASMPNYLSWRERSQDLKLAAFSGQTLNWTGQGTAERLEAMAATASYLPVLGRNTLHGRWFLENEQTLGNHRLAVLSERVWRARFGAEVSAIGRTLMFNGSPYRVIGVAPSDLPADPDPDLWVPLVVDPQAKRDNHYITVIGRLEQGRSIEQAQASLQSIASVLQQEFPATNDGWSVTLTPLMRWIVPDQVRTSLFLLFAAVAIVAVIMCANVANLLLTRAEARRKEIAIREALGAGVLRLTRQLLTESLALALAGGLLGIVAAFLLVSIARQSLLEIVPRAGSIAVDFTVLAYAIAVATITGLLFGAAPVARVLRNRRMDALYTAGRSSQPGVAGGLRRAIVVAQVALATLLVITAGLTVRSFARLQQVSPGFDGERVLTARLNVPRARYANGVAINDMLTRLTEALRSTPGIEAAGIGSAIPLGPGAHAVRRAQPVPANGSQLVDCEWRLADAGFFQALRIPLLHGRWFTEAESQPVFIISREAARVLYGREDAIGRQLKLDNGVTGEVIGITGDLRMKNLAGPPDRVVYIPTSQFGFMPFFAIFIRTQHDFGTAGALLRERLSDIDPNLPAYGVRSMESWLDQNSARPRIRTGVLSMLAFVAVMLGVVGIYGVLSYLVSLRKQEFGIRMAMGAQPSDVMALVTREGVLLALAGILLGTVGAAYVAGMLETTLFQVSTYDPLTFVAAPCLLLLSALAACLAPAVKAAMVDPVVALRAE